MKRLRLYIGFSLLLLSGGVAASLPENSLEWFARLDALELPDVSNGIPICLHLVHRPERSSHAGGLTIAWLLSERWDEKADSKRFMAVVDGIRLLQVTEDVEKPDYRRETEVCYDLPPPPGAPRAYGTWSEVDLKEHVAIEHTWIQRGWGDRSNIQAGLFVLAYQLWKRGATELIPEIWVALESAEGGLEGVWHDTVQMLGNVEYEMAYWQWLEDGDWKGFHQRVTGLMKKYSSDWDAYPVMQMLAERIEKTLEYVNVDAGTVPDPAGRDVTLREVVNVRALRSSWMVDDDRMPFAWWLFPSTWSAQLSAPFDVEARIYAQGLNAMHCLASLVEAEVLTGVGTDIIRGRFGFQNTNMRFSKIASATSDGERQTAIQQAFKEMPRPVTSGELGEYWVKNLLPLSWPPGSLGWSWDRFRMDHIELAQRFHKEYGSNLTEGTQALIYMNNSEYSGNYQRDLHARMREQLCHAVIPEFEEYLVEGSLTMEWEKKVEWVIIYAVIRWEDSNSLIQRFRMLLLETANEIEKENRAHPDSAYTRPRPNRLRYVADFLSIFPQSEEALIKYFFKLDQPYNSHVLNHIFQRSTLAQVVDTLIPYAAYGNGATSEVRHHIADKLNRLPVGDNSISPTTSADAWEILIDDDRSSNTNIARTYLLLNERLFGNQTPLPSWNYMDRPGNNGEWLAREFLSKYGAIGQELLKKRVRLRLRGVPENELPSFEELAAEAQTVFRNDVRDALWKVNSIAELNKLNEGFSFAQREALPNILMEDQNLNRRVFNMMPEKMHIQLGNIPEDWRERFLAWQHKPPSSDLLNEMMAFMAECAAQNRPMSALLLYRNDYSGWSLIVEPIPLSEEQKIHKRPISGYSGTICARGIYEEWDQRNTQDGNAEDRSWLSGNYTDSTVQAALARFWDGSLPATSMRFIGLKTKEYFW